jgi:hypothetical protein
MSWSNRTVITNISKVHVRDNKFHQQEHALTNGESGFGVCFGVTTVSANT